MNIQPTSNLAWPAHVCVASAAARVVEADDGRAFELEPFRDACRQQAIELRRQAMADAAAAAGAGVRRLRDAALRLLRPARGRAPSARVRGA